MARTVAALPEVVGFPATDLQEFPVSQAHGLAATAKASIRERDLPGHVVVYYVIALAPSCIRPIARLLRCLLEWVQFMQLRRHDRLV